MMNSSIQACTEDDSVFIEALLDSLNPEEDSSFGLKNALLLQELGDRVLSDDVEIARVERLGAVSLLGALALAYDPSIHASNSIDQEARTPLYRAQAASFIARDILIKLVPQLYEKGKTEYGQLAQSLVEHPMVDSTEHLAIELEACGLESGKTLLGEELLSEEDHDVEVAPGAGIDNPRSIALDSLDKGMFSVLDKMDWIDPSLITTLQVQDVLHDGEVVAILADLTPGNHKLKKFMEELLHSQSGETFWNKLAQEIVHFTLRGTSNRIKGNETEKLPTFYMKNRGSSEIIVRAYYTTLGRTEQDIPLIGLMAAARTKGSQRTVLRFLINGRNKV